MTEYARAIDVGLFRPQLLGRFLGEWITRNALFLIVGGVVFMSAPQIVSIVPDPGELWINAKISAIETSNTQLQIENLRKTPSVFATSGGPSIPPDNKGSNKGGFLPVLFGSLFDDIAEQLFPGYADPGPRFPLWDQVIGVLLTVPSKGPFNPISFNPANMICAIDINTTPALTGCGSPFRGTHNDCKSWSNGPSCSGGWVSENGSDWCAPGGTPVVAIISGVIGGPGVPGCNYQFGANNSGQARMYLCGDDGNEYYMTHLDENALYVSAGERVTQGKLLALLDPAGVTHVHLAVAGQFGGCTSCGQPTNLDDPAIAVWAEWHKCCVGLTSNTDCTSIDPGTIPPPPGGGGGSGSIGLPRPLPDPFECVAPDVVSCVEPPNSLNPPGYTQENCIPIDATCAQGTCFGICLNEDGNTMGNVEELAEAIYEYDEETGEIIGIASNPIATLNSGATAGAYCAYEVADRCGDPAQGGACAFVLECEQKRVCENEQCVLKPGRNLEGKEVSCDSNADCRTSYNTCLGSQCVSVSGAGEDECGISGSLACPQCVRENVAVLDSEGNPLFEPDGTSITEEICERPVVQQACVTKDNASLYYLKSSPTDLGDVTRRERLWTEIPLEEYLIDNPYFGTTLEEDGGGQCAQVTCIDENGDGEITWNIDGEPNECAPPAQWCSNETSCGISEILGVEPPEEIGDPPEIRCGDGVCAEEEEEGGEFACEVDCILRQDPLPPFPHGEGPVGEGLSLSTCSDTDGDGVFDSCVSDGESTILCSENTDCTRAFHSTCQGDTCIIATGPGSNMCGEPATAIDTAALDDAICSLDCPDFPPAGASCGVGTGDCAPEFLAQIFGPEEACNASVICQRESGAIPTATNGSCIRATPGFDGSGDYNHPTPVEYSIGLFQINLTAGMNPRTGAGGRCASGTFSWDGRQCSVANQIQFDTCLANWGFGNPLVNAQRAYEIWSTQGWSPWSTAWSCGIVN